MTDSTSAGHAATASTDTQVAQWRGYLARHAAISTDDLDEMEDHVREQIAELQAVGLSPEEAFLVALTRLGAVDVLSAEFAREHADRLWKQLDFAPSLAPVGRHGSGELVAALIAGVGAGIAVKVGSSLLNETRFALTASLIVAPFLAAYFAWQRKVSAAQVGIIIAVFAITGIVAGTYPFTATGDSTVIAAIHMPIIAWCCVGVAYAGSGWRTDAGRMNFIRFTGEFLVYYVLIALGGGALVGLTVGSFAAIGMDATGIVTSWVLPFAVPGAALVAAYLVEAKQSVIENIAPVLTRVFLPLTIVLILALLAAYITGGTGWQADRTLLIMMDLVLVLVLGQVIYAISARRRGEPSGPMDWMLFVLITAALITDALVLLSMAQRIVAAGWSPNKVTALGGNLVLLVNLAVSAWLTARILPRRSTSPAARERQTAAVERWQTRYLPTFGAWAFVVVLAVPPFFDFA